MLTVHMACIQKGGTWERNDGKTAGLGLKYHFKEGIKLIWPEFKQNRWFDLFLESWLVNQYIGVMGPKNSGKTASSAIVHLFDWYCFPSKTTVLFCSTTKEMLENRIWGEVKMRHRSSKQRFSWLPGHLIEGRQRIILDTHDEISEGRDFRSGMMGIPLKRGGAFQGISDIIGIKNKRKRLCGDELQAIPKAFIDATANFIEPGADCKVTGMGNPAETTDSLGILCEPDSSIGGWDSGIDQTPKTKTWKTRFDRGICIQLPGSDSPNNDAKPGEPIPFSFLMTRQQMEADAKTWGVDDWHFTMFNEGRMPRGQGARRIITKQLCITHGAMKEPNWSDRNQTKITFLDAAYRAVGGDRCVFGQLNFGMEQALGGTAESILSSLTSQEPIERSNRQVMALVDIMTIPIRSDDFTSPEDQIVAFVKSQCELRGVPPTNFFFDAGMRTSLVTAFSRIWSPHVNSIDFGGTPSDRMVSADIRQPCKEYYKKFVTELWYQVRLIVESNQFRNLSEDVMMEGCQREWKTSGNRIEVETKAEMKEKTGKSPDLFDALCLTETTKILTPLGEKNISDLKVGDTVVTPKGEAMIATIHSHTATDICEVIFSNGKKIMGTIKHKIFTTDGWCQLDALGVDMEVEICDNLPLWKILNLLFTTTKNIGFKQQVDIIHEIGKPIKRRDFFIGLYGVSVMGLFQKACACIIKTAIGKIIKSKIWHWLKEVVTLPITCGIAQNLLNDLQMKFLQLEGNTPNYGINLKTEENGILSMENKLGLIGVNPMHDAYFAAKPSKQLLLQEHGSVPISVDSHSLISDLKMMLESAVSVVKCFWRIATKKHRIAPVAVRHLPPHESKRVYNLTLDRDNVYFANGILVANCCGVEGAIRKGFVIRRQKPQDVPEIDEHWKQDLAVKANKFWASGKLDYAA